jgi:CHAT domain-containing protein
VVLFSLFATLAGPSEDTTAPGVVVERIAEGGLADGQLQVGDVLMSWQRPARPPTSPESADGDFRTPYDRIAVEWEHAARAPVKLLIERNGARESVTLADTGWGIKTRPQFSTARLQRYLEGHEAISGGDPEGGLQTWRQLAQDLIAAGDHADAAWLLMRVAETLGRNQPFAALTAYTESLDQARASANLLIESVMLTKRGRQAWATGDAASAEQDFLQALSRRQALAGLPLLVAAPHEHLGILYERTGRLQEAEHHYLRALDVSRTHTSHSFSLVPTLRNLASLATLRGRLDEADRLLREALALTREQSAENIDVAAVLNQLGGLEHTRGNLEEAERLLSQSLQMKQRLAPDTEVAHSLAELGEVARLGGDLERAGELVQQSLALHRAQDPTSADTAWSLFRLGKIARQRGDLERAHALLAQALSVFEQRLPGTLQTAAILCDLGQVQADQGDLEAAATSQRRSLEISASMAPGSLQEAEPLYHLADISRRQGELAVAAADLQRSLGALETHIERLGGGRRVQAGFRAQMQGFYSAYLETLLDLDRPQQAFQVLERSRARMLLIRLAERDLVFGLDLPPELDAERRQAASFYDAVQAQLARVSEQREPERFEQLQAMLRDLQRQQEELRQKTLQLSPRFAALQYPQPVGVDGARQALDPRTVLLAYAVSRDAVRLFVISAVPEASQSFAVLDLDTDEATLAGQVRALRDYVASGRDQAREAIRAGGRHLYELLVRPAEPWLGQAERILICPDGPLHHLPFSALVRHGSDGVADQYLVEWKPLHTVLSATLYEQLRAQRRETTTDRPVVAFGDPLHPLGDDRNASRTGELHPASSLPGSRGLTRLPASRIEVEHIAAVWQDRARVLVGPDATEERARELAQPARILHFAAHGLLDERFPLNSALLLAASGEPGEAGTNGLLQAWEVFEQLRTDADLVVMSACDSALGEALRGEGLIGLTQAFHYAGAPSVVASLWAAPDASTAALMQILHEQLHDGTSVDEALRNAQLALIRGPVELSRSDGTTDTADLSHPFAWAGFQLFGDRR